MSFSLPFDKLCGFCLSDGKQVSCLYVVQIKTTVRKMSGKKNDRSDFQNRPVGTIIELGNLTAEIVNPNVIVNLVDPERDEQHQKPAPLLDAVQSGDLERLKKELSTHKDQINETFGSLRVTLLHLAAYDQPHLVPTLISNGANVTILDVVGRSSFHLACTAASNPGCIKALIIAGADVNQKILLPFQMWSPSPSSSSSRKASPVVEMKKKMGSNNGLGFEKKLLFQKKPTISQEIFKLPNIGVGSHLPIPESLGRTGLHQTVKANSPDCVEVLLKAGALVDAKDQKGLTPLLLAGAGVTPDDAERLIKYEQVVKMLVAAGADVNILNPYTGTSALHHAAARCSLSATRLLMEHGAVVEKLSASGATALHEAAHSGALQVLEYILDTTEGLNLVNKSDHVGLTPLHKAAFSGSRGCLELLLKKGGHLGVQTHSGTSVLDAVFMHVARPYHFLASIFDRCVETNSISVLDTAFKVHLDFSILSPRGCDRQTSILREIFTSPNGPGQSVLLRHPLLETFLWLKWQKLRIFFFFLLFIYGSFVASLSAYIVAESESHEANATDVSINTSNVAKHFLAVTSIMLLIHVVLQFTLRPIFYIKDIETWNFAFLGTSSLVVVYVLHRDPDTCIDKPVSDYFQVQLISIIVLLAWTELLLMIGRFPTWGNYALMFYTVLRNVLKVMLTFVFIVIGFTLSFYVQFHDEEIFSDPAKAFVKTIVMMAGEFEYKELFEEKEPTDGRKHAPNLSGRIIFLLFVLLTTIVMMNLMVGLAVSDIQAVQAEGHFRRLLKQAQFVDHLETIISHSIFKKGLPKCIMSFLTQRRRVVTELTLQPSAVDRKTRYPKNLPRRLIEACVELAVRQRAISQLKTDEEMMSGDRTSRYSWLDSRPGGSQTDLFGVQQQAAMEDMMLRLFEELQDVKNMIQVSSSKPLSWSARGRTLSIKESRRLNQHLNVNGNERTSKLEDVVCEVQGAHCVLQRLKED
ncbi:transient receptor potential channel pyrexia-like isoform X2 [Cloeon dipterum]|uniref:transient receptor potential channel pyrexia-like isoform X2 n=1 Tax=Cloeon dipterum TaxID=197152 RepID=UPI00322062D6